MAGQHKDRKNRKKFVRAAVTASTIPMIVLSASPAQAQPASAWDKVIDCESGGKNVQNPSSTASGYFQITNGTWASAGGTEFAPRAIDATFEQQAIVAQRIAERRGSLADWNASIGCWGDVINSEVPDAPASSNVTAPVVVETVPVAAPVSGTYVVQEDEYLSGIADALGYDWHELATLNGLAEPYTLSVGQVLQLPQAPGYTVVPGDTLSEIATDEFKLPSWEPLYEQNRAVIGDDPNLIIPGQVFFVGGLPVVNAPVATEVPESTTAPAVSVSVAHPTGGTAMTSGYGPRGGEFHDGVDLDCAIGDPIYAAAAGIVEQNLSEAESGGYGIKVYIRHPDGSATFYGHMSRSDVSYNQFVEAGQQIGACGNTGQVVAGPGGDGSHLHFGAEIGPGSINPVTWASDRGLTL